MSLHNLRALFREERDKHGTYMGDNENAYNATERRVSCRTDQEILDLINEAEKFIELANAELTARDREHS